MGFSLRSITDTFKKGVDIIGDPFDIGFNVLDPLNVNDMLFPDAPNLDNSADAAFNREQERLREERMTAQADARAALREGVGTSRQADFSFGGTDLSLNDTETPETFNVDQTGETARKALNKALPALKSSLASAVGNRLNRTRDKTDPGLIL